MKKTCPKCGADGNGKPAPKESRFWCSSSAWEDGDFYQSPECVKRERDNLLERVKELESYAERLVRMGDKMTPDTTGDMKEAWELSKEAKP
jgi:hypothetical protein